VFKRVVGEFRIDRVMSKRRYDGIRRLPASSSLYVGDLTLLDNPNWLIQTLREVKGLVDVEMWDGPRGLGGKSPAELRRRPRLPL
jgi:hypothetical protein